MHRTTLSATAALAISLVLANSAGAETTAENAIKYRHAVMETMAGHAEAFAMIAFGQVENAEFLQGHADSLASAGAQLAVLFPEGSGVGETGALSAIWDEPDKFGEAVTKAQQATAALPDAVASGDKKTIAGAFKVLGEACKGCHENFREEHE